MTRPESSLPEQASPATESPAKDCPAKGRPTKRARYFVPRQRSRLRRWITANTQKTGRRIGRLLFDAEGHPRAFLRSLLFDAYQRPRPGLEGVIFKEPGRPRRPFANWLTGSDATLPALVAGLPFPPRSTGRRSVLVVIEKSATSASPLLRLLARDYAVVLLVLDGERGADEALAADGVALVPVDVARARAPRAVLVDALAFRAREDRPLFAITVGLATIDAADALEQRNIPVVAVFGEADADPARHETLGPAMELALERASALVFPTPAAREAALVAMPRFAARRRLAAAEAPLEAGAAAVLAIGREIGEELDCELSLVLATEPERLEILDIARENDPPGAFTVAQKLERLIADWRRKALLKRHPNRPPLRRPYSGFHPLIYAEHHPVACFDQRRYPLSHWIEKGRPPGPWSMPVFGPLPGPRASRLRSALHGHFFYPDLLPELLERLNVNASRPDLFLTTDTPAKADELRAMTASYPSAVQIDVVPNLGRDIGPFLTGLRDALTGGGYDVFFHVHGKKTKGRRRAIGDPWRHFLWENLIGGTHPMLDTVLARLEVSPEVGLIHPEDSHLVNWARNDRIVQELREDLELTEPLGAYVDFPVGNMFAIRPAAMRSYLALDLSWEDYPPEPIPDDGTLMHGLERLLPMAVRQAGFSTIAVRVPGTDWD
ncbi:rhamnan synthesis protein F [Ancylobacter aquaticus]|uniref:Rhamnan synthesis protein F n=1 Tax=Ancylobacter aquaticus TaxID=100 RepID=A0A4R1I7U7_ANCAQ|nr:rhamnan synthesis F family protein [Ancylobacter aquaticus]TCK31487.1 rhamnan synthesis protein F [Ancylobacter aquaticus]